MFSFLQCYKIVTIILIDVIKCVIIKVRLGGVVMNGLLGARIKILRNAANYTQEYVADRIGISRQKYARIENGTNNITLEVLSRIAKVLDVQVNDITRVLDDVPVVEYRARVENGSAQTIFDMLDLFYANKHLQANIYNSDLR